MDKGDQGSFKQIQVNLLTEHRLAHKKNKPRTQKVIENNSEKALQAAEINGRFPGPSFELEFWESKSHNLRVLMHQLSDQKIQLVIKILERAASTYVTALKITIEELVNGMIFPWIAFIY